MMIYKMIIASIELDTWAIHASGVSKS